VNNEWRIIKDLEASDCSPIERKWRKPRKVSVRISLSQSLFEPSTSWVQIHRVIAEPVWPATRFLQILQFKWHSHDNYMRKYNMGREYSTHWRNTKYTKHLLVIIRRKWYLEHFKGYAREY
jgi:hypothetical protein